MTGVRAGRAAERMVLAAGAGVLALAAFALVSKVQSNPGWPNGTDLDVYRAAADSILAGGHPYVRNLYTYDPYGYPPLFAELVALLRSVLGWGEAWLIWPLLCTAALFGAMYLLMRRFGVRLHIGWIVLATGLLALGHLGRTELFHGQPDFVLLLLLVAGLVCFRNGRKIAGAIAWGLMIVVKPFLGVIVFFQLRRGQWREAAMTVASSAAFFFAGFALFGAKIVEAVTGWLSASRWYTTIPNVAKPANQSLYGFFTRMTVGTEHSEPWINAPGLAGWLMPPLVALALGALYIGISPNLANARSEAEAGGLDLLESGLPLAFAFALGPLAEAPHLYLLIPAAFGAGLLAWTRWSSVDARPRWSVALLFWAALLGMFTIPFAVKLFMPYHWATLTGPELLASAFNAVVVLGASVASIYALRAGKGFFARTAPV